MERLDATLIMRTLQCLLPEGGCWDGLTVRAPAWQMLESVGRDSMFLRRLTLAGALAMRPDVMGGKVQVSFPSAPAECDAAAEERIAGSVVRRAVLAMASGVADRVAIGMNPSVGVAKRHVLSAAIRELLDQLEGARFERRLPAGDPERDFLFEFSRTGKHPVLVGWTDGEPRLVSAPLTLASASDYLCRQVPILPHPRIRLTRTMAYFVGGA